MKPEQRKPYAKPAVVFEKELEALAADCGTGTNNTWLGGNNCKGVSACTVPWS